VLSLKPQVTATSSAINNRARQTRSVEFRTVGFGQCGIIFQQSYQGYTLKVLRSLFGEALWSDLKAHFAIFQAFEQQLDVEVRVPRIFSYVHREDFEWWETLV
jgi:hypothetical protein